MWFLLLSFLASAETGSDLVERAAAGHQLPQADGLYLRWDPARSWGSARLCATLQDVSLRLAVELPHADPLLVGDISRRGGGWMPGHRTHHLGIDADIGLFTHGGKQPLGGFQDLQPDQLDLAANWALVRALIDHPDVSFILLDQRHIDALRSYVANEVGLPQDEIDAIFPPRGTQMNWERARGVVRHVPNHRSHLHVRVSRRSDDT